MCLGYVRGDLGPEEARTARRGVPSTAWLCTCCCHSQYRSCLINMLIAAFGQKPGEEASVKVLGGEVCARVVPITPCTCPCSEHVRRGAAQ